MTPTSTTKPDREFRRVDVFFSEKELDIIERALVHLKVSRGEFIVTHTVDQALKIVKLMEPDEDDDDEDLDPDEPDEDDDDEDDDEDDDD